MSNSKFDLIQSISQQQQKAEHLQASLLKLSETLSNFEQLIEQSEKPIISSTTLLNKVQQTTIALESHLSAILSEIGNLSPQALKSQTASYSEQIDVLTAQLSSIDISTIKSVQTRIESFSISMQTLQKEINSKLQSIEIDQASLQQVIQTQLQQAIENNREQTEQTIANMISEKLSTQKTTYIGAGLMIFSVLILLTSFYFAYQARMNLKTIEAQQEMIDQNAQTIQNQIKIKNLSR